MLFTLGVGSATSLAGGLITLLHDQFPNQDKKHLTIIVCIVGFFSGLLYVTPGKHADIHYGCVYYQL